jgi:hypothetical protein
VLHVLLQAAMLRWKLTTRRHDGASEEFTEKHKAELGPEEIKKAEQHLAAQVGGPLLAGDRRYLY